MGLPRHLHDDMWDFLNNCSKADLFDLALVMARIPGYATALHKLCHSKGAITKGHQLLTVSKWGWRSTAPRSKAHDELTRITGRLYVGLERIRQTDQPSFREVEIPIYFRERLEKLNKDREDRDRQALALRQRIDDFRGRVFASRTFPAALKAIIFERDNYTCKLCLRGRDELQKAGLHLECDHIKEWEDGGLTTYENGQTICSGCNKGKHHSKAYLGLVSSLRNS